MRSKKTTYRKVQLAFTKWRKLAAKHGDRSPQAWGAYQDMLDARDAYVNARKEMER
jgi:hypothetical protein